MHLSNRWSQAGIWFATGLLAALACSLTLPSATLKGEYLPVGNDSFYHARRILDTVRDLASFYQFDSKIHAPEGSLLAWPWGYDYAMALLTRAALALGISSDPMAILAWIPVLAVFISIGLLIVVARRLDLSTPLVALAALCMALSPTTQLMHGVGQIDHHYAELIFLLAALGGGLGWLREPESKRRAAQLALVLGIAPAIHNGLFVLQVPLLATLFVFWLQGRRMPVGASRIFAGLLLASTLAALLPSLPFRLGRFEFYTHSWFHLYVASCTAAAVVFMSHVEATRARAVALVLGSGALLIPIVSQVLLAQSFIAGTPVQLQGIGEMQPPLRIAKLFGAQTVSNYYSYLVWFVPLTALLCIVRGWHERNSARLLFWISATTGLALLSTQIRMHYFGDFALYMPWLVVLQDFVLKRPELRKTAFLLASLALLLLYFPSLRHQLVAPAPRANDISFENLRPIFNAMHRACAERPGIVLADGDAGHFIRYYTDCSVIADNFLLTPQQMAKADEVNRLFGLPASQVLTEAPEVRYVLVRPFTIGPGPNGKLRYTFLVASPRLANDLLLGTGQSIPPEFVLLDLIRFPELGNAPYAALYEIRRTAGTAASGAHP